LKAVKQTARYCLLGGTSRRISVIANAVLVFDVAHNRCGVADRVVRIVRFAPRQALKHKRNKTDEESGLVSYFSDICRMAPDLPRQTASEQLRTG
jgi:hypothetical protein